MQILQQQLNQLSLRVNGMVLKYDKDCQEPPADGETNHQPWVQLLVRLPAKRRRNVIVHSVLVPANTQRQSDKSTFAANNRAATISLNY